MPTIHRLDGSTQEISAEEFAALRQATPVPGGSGAPGLEPPPQVGGPPGQVMTPEQQRDALLNLLPVLGGMIGPLLGPQGAAGTGIARLAPVAMGALNAAVGGAGGQAAGDATRAAFGDETAPASLGEAGGRAVDAGTEQAMQEVVGRGVGRVAGALSTGAKHVGAYAKGKALPFAERVTDLGKGVIDTVMRESSKFEPILTPLAHRLGIATTAEGALKLPLTRVSKVTASKALDLLTKISESAPLSGFEVAVKNFGTGGGSAIVKQIADDFGKYAAPNELGEALLMSNAGLVESHKLVENKVWRYLLVKAKSKPMQTATQSRTVTSPILGPDGNPITSTAIDTFHRRGVRIPVESLNRLTKPLRKLEREIRGVGSQADLVGVADRIAAIRNDFDALLKQDPTVSFEAAKLLRSRLSAEVDRISTLIGGKTPAKGTATRLRKQIDMEMRKALKEQAPELVPIFDTANRLTTQRGRTLQNPLVEELTQKVTKYTENGVPVFKGPLGDIPATIFEGPGAAGKIEQFRHAVSPQQFDEMANSWVQQKLAIPPDESASIIPKVYDGNALRHTFSADGPNGETLAALFKTRPGDLDRLRKWTDVLASSQLKPGEGGQLGTLAIMSTQWGAIATVTGTALGVGAGTYAATDSSMASLLGAGGVILTPPIMSKFMNSPLGYQMLTRAVSPSTTAREAAKLASKIALQVEKFKKGLNAVERAFSDNVEMQLRQMGEPEAAPQPLPPTAQPTPLAAGS